LDYLFLYRIIVFVLLIMYILFLIDKDILSKIVQKIVVLSHCLIIIF